MTFSLFSVNVITECLVVVCVVHIFIYSKCLTFSYESFVVYLSRIYAIRKKHLAGTMQKIAFGLESIQFMLFHTIFSKGPNECSIAF